MQCTHTPPLPSPDETPFHPPHPHLQLVRLCVYTRVRIAGNQPTLPFLTTTPHHTPSTGIGRFYCFPGQYPAQAQEGKEALAVGGVASTRGRGAVSNTDSAGGSSATASLQPVVAPLSVTLLGNGFEAASNASAESAAAGGSRGPVKLTLLCPSDHYCLRGTFELCCSQQ
jgi:hypothetical protein